MPSSSSRAPHCSTVTRVATVRVNFVPQFVGDLHPDCLPCPQHKTGVCRPLFYRDIIQRSPKAALQMRTTSSLPVGATFSLSPDAVLDTLRPHTWAAAVILLSTLAKFEVSDPAERRWMSVRPRLAFSHPSQEIFGSPMLFWARVSR